MLESDVKSWPTDSSSVSIFVGFLKDVFPPPNSDVTVREITPGTERPEGYEWPARRTQNDTLWSVYAGGQRQQHCFIAPLTAPFSLWDWGFPEFDRIVLDAALLLRRKESSINKWIVPPFRFLFFFFFLIFDSFRICGNVSTLGGGREERGEGVGQVWYGRNYFGSN